MTFGQLLLASPYGRLVAAILLSLFLPKEAASSLRGATASRRVAPAGFFIPFDYASRLVLLRSRRNWRWHVWRVLCLAYLSALLVAALQ
jgi:hypothetical protein